MAHLYQHAFNVHTAQIVAFADVVIAENNVIYNDDNDDETWS